MHAYWTSNLIYMQPTSAARGPRAIQHIPYTHTGWLLQLATIRALCHVVTKCDALLMGNALITQILWQQDYSDIVIWLWRDGMHYVEFLWIVFWSPRSMEQNVVQVLCQRMVALIARETFTVFIHAILYCCSMQIKNIIQGVPKLMPKTIRRDLNEKKFL